MENLDEQLLRQVSLQMEFDDLLGEKLPLRQVRNLAVSHLATNMADELEGPWVPAERFYRFRFAPLELLQYRRTGIAVVSCSCLLKDREPHERSPV